MDAGYIYLFSSRLGLTKIGKSRTPRERVKSFERAPFYAEIIHTIRTDAMSALERYLHFKYAEYRKQGEWFELPEADLLELTRRLTWNFEEGVIERTATPKHLETQLERERKLAYQEGQQDAHIELYAAYEQKLEEQRLAYAGYSNNLREQYEERFAFQENYWSNQSWAELKHLLREEVYAQRTAELEWLDWLGCWQAELSSKTEIPLAYWGDPLARAKWLLAPTC
jgi:hypothetical protein